MYANKQEFRFFRLLKIYKKLKISASLLATFFEDMHTVLPLTLWNTCGKQKIRIEIMRNFCAKKTVGPSSRHLPVRKLCRLL